jgi:hypothetical protein
LAVFTHVVSPTKRARQTNYFCYEESMATTIAMDMLRLAIAPVFISIVAKGGRTRTNENCKKTRLPVER